MSATIEHRVATLAARYDAIESALREVQKCMSCASGSSSTSAGAAKKKVDPSTITALKPCAQDTPEVASLRAWCLSNKLYASEFKWVPSDYYTHNLQWRRDILSAPSINHLCKTIVMENTKCEHEDCSDRLSARYYMIVYRYVDKFNAESLSKLMRQLNPKLSKRSVNFRLADPEKSLELTGFGHGAVCPFGTKHRIPVIMCSEITKMAPARVWMGGGHVDCKVRVDVQEFLDVVDPIVAGITVPLTPEELEMIAD